MGWVVTKNHVHDTEEVQKMYVDGLLACVEQHSQALGSSDETEKPHMFINSVYSEVLNNSPSQCLVVDK
jgi:hypothetical protein